MLTMLGSTRRLHSGITRRQTLQAASLGGLAGLYGLSPSTTAASTAVRREGRAKSVIMLYLLGGAPTQDMFDLKPNAPSDVRGEFNPIPSSVPGIEVCEHLPGVAQSMASAAIVRSVNHKAGCHNTLPSYTGFEQPLDNIVSTKDTYPPSMGSVCEYLRTGPRNDPAYVYMPCYLGWGQSIRRPGPYAGFLGSQYDPMFTECAPYVDKPPDLPYASQPLRGLPLIPNSRPTETVTLDRLNRRRSLLQQFDSQVAAAESNTASAKYDRATRRAWSLLSSSPVRAAFDLESEDPRVREQFGNTLFGQSALVARRLVEAGVDFINVTWDCYYERLQLQYECWDTHSKNFSCLKNYNLPVFDRVYAALISDLSMRGLLDQTLVVVMTDFGRTPKINASAGRDHWTFCYSVMLAGAGIRGGTVHGESDAQAAFPKTHPVSTGDICATIYHCLGINPEGTVPDALGRPVGISHGGRPIESILV